RSVGCSLFSSRRRHTRFSRDWSSDVCASDLPAGSLGLRPAMSLRSRLLGVQHLAAGAEVGYGAIFRADRPMRVGVVACGYADGYPRHAPTGTPVVVGGVRTRLVGRVSMDMLMVDVDPVSAAEVGTPESIWGQYVPEVYD